MKNTIYLLFVLFLISACGNKNITKSTIDASAIETDSKNIDEPILTFKNTSHDFGTIVEGQRVEHTFKFKNTGKSALIISSCKASCGCTIPDWPKEPIEPGESGEIKVEFNSAGKSQAVTKDITILANTNPVSSIIKIDVFVEPKD